MILRRLRGAVMARSRRRKLEHFYALAQPSRVLDVGVTENDHDPSVNIFLKEFRFSDDRYVGLGIENLHNISALHPGKSFVMYSPGRFPFADAAFDWGFANAVVEHVGSRGDQLLFLNELWRTCRNIFLTTPNRYSPFDPHTKAIGLHWLPDPIFFAWCARWRPYWHPGNLNLLSYTKLKRLLEDSDMAGSRIASGRFLGWPITYTVVVQR